KQSKARDRRARAIRFIRAACPEFGLPSNSLKKWKLQPHRHSMWVFWLRNRRVVVADWFADQAAALPDDYCSGRTMVASGSSLNSALEPAKAPASSCDFHHDSIKLSSTDLVADDCSGR